MKAFPQPGKNEGMDGWYDPEREGMDQWRFDPEDDREVLTETRTGPSEPAKWTVSPCSATSRAYATNTERAGKRTWFKEARVSHLARLFFFRFYPQDLF